MIDGENGLLWRFGENKAKFNQWQEAIIPENETLIGFRVVKNPRFKVIKGLGIVTKLNH